MRASWTDSIALITDSDRDTRAAMKCVGLKCQQVSHTFKVNDE